MQRQCLGCGAEYLDGSICSDCVRNGRSQGSLGIGRPPSSVFSAPGGPPPSPEPRSEPSRAAQVATTDELISELLGLLELAAPLLHALAARGVRLEENGVIAALERLARVAGARLRPQR